MKELQRRQKVRRWMYSLPVCLLVLAVAAFLVNGTVRVVGKQIESAEKVSELRAKEAALVARQAELEKNIRDLETEEGVVREIKEKFNVSAEGEYMVVIVDEKPNPASTTPQKKSWLKRLWLAIIQE